MLIYVSSPYTNPDDMIKLHNVEQSMRAGHAVLAKGHYPVLPLLSHWFELFCKRDGLAPLTYDNYIEWDLALLDPCHAMVLLPGWESSKGCTIEHNYFITLGRPIYHGLDAIPEAL